MNIGPIYRKLVVFNAAMERCIIDEHHEEGRPAVEWLREQGTEWSVPGRTDIKNRREVTTPEFKPGTFQEILMPLEEFHTLLFGLPEMEDLPIAYAAFKAVGEPDEFIARCFEGEYDEGTGFYVERQGFNYARYKAYLFE